MPKRTLKPVTRGLKTKEPEITIIDDETMKALTEAIRSTWNAIAYDIIQACEESGDKLDDEAAMETTIDANHMTMYGGKRGKEMDKLVGDLCAKHGYDIVLKYLAKKIPLV